MISILYYILALSMGFVTLLLGAIITPFSLLFNGRRRALHEMTRAVTRAFFTIIFTWRKSISGFENIDKNRSYVIVANHQSMIDILAIYYIPLHFKWVSKREVYFIPMFGQYLWLQGNITIDRKSGVASMEKILNMGTKWLSEGVSIVIFPEGTRSKSGEIGRFKAGAFNLAAEAGVDILPVVMDGTSSLFKGKLSFNWRNKLTVKVLPAIPAEQVVNSDLKELMGRVKSDMVDALKSIREE
ncbi:MAG: lysophospholipid acyltransferase family protein [Rikenellaceae bacterium]